MMTTNRFHDVPDLLETFTSMIDVSVLPMCDIDLSRVGTDHIYCTLEIDERVAINLSPEEFLDSYLGPALRSLANEVNTIGRPVHFQRFVPQPKVDRFVKQEILTKDKICLRMTVEYFVDEGNPYYRINLDAICWAGAPVEFPETD